MQSIYFPTFLCSFKRIEREAFFNILRLNKNKKRREEKKVCEQFRVDYSRPTKVDVEREVVLFADKSVDNLVALTERRIEANLSMDADGSIKPPRSFEKTRWTGRGRERYSRKGTETRKQVEYEK